MNYMSGGPLDGLIMDTPELLKRHKENLGLYRFTDGFRYVPESRNPCRVWQHVGSFSQEVRNQIHQNERTRTMSEITATPENATQELSPLEVERRDAKISRQNLADRSGLTGSAIWRIERKPDSKRTTEEEIQKYKDALAELKAEREAGATAKAPEKPAPAGETNDVVETDEDLDENNLAF